MASTKGDELVKYITEQVVTYIETPKAERRRVRRESWSVRWFGMIPISLSIWSQSLRPKKSSLESEEAMELNTEEKRGMEQELDMEQEEHLAEEVIQDEANERWQVDIVN